LVFTLSEGARVRYSAGERTMFALLPKSGGTISTTTLSQRFQKEKPSAAFNSRKVVNGLLTSLRKKIEFNDEPFRLKNSERSGPIPMRFWLERKK